MAKGVQIPIEVVDKFSQQLSNMESRLNDITKAAEKQSKGFQLLSADIALRYGREAKDAIVQFGKDAIHSFEAQETANSRLRIAMQNLGVFTETAYQQQLKFAEAMQGSTAFADEQITELQATLTTFGLYGKQLQNVTKVALDLAAAQRIDVSQAAMLVGKAFVGETGALGKLGFQFEESATAAQKFASFLDQAQRRMGGSAAAELDTHAGKVKNLANAYDSLKEKIGADLVSSSESSTTALGKLVLMLDKNYDAIKRTIAVNFGNIVGGGVLGSIYDVIAGFDRQAAAAEAAYQAGTKALSDTRKNIKPPPRDDPEANKAAAEAEKMRLELSERAATEALANTERAQKYIESRTITNQEVLDLEAERMANELAIEGQGEFAKEVIRARSLERDKVINAERVTATRSMFTQLAALQTAKSKELAAIGKAAAFAQAVINAHLAATQAMAAFAAIPPVAIAMGALMEAAGMAQALMIAGVPLKDGGIAKARPGGIQATIAEGGEDEVVAPLSKLRGMLGLPAGRGGASVSFGDINVTVQAGDVGSPADRRSLAEQLVEELRRAAAPAIEASILMAQMADRNSARAV